MGSDTSELSSSMIRKIRDANTRNILERLKAGKTLTKTELGVLDEIEKRQLEKKQEEPETIDPSEKYEGINQYVRNKTQLAKLIGRTRQQINLYCRDPRFADRVPEAMSDGRHDVWKWLEFIEYVDSLKEGETEEEKVWSQERLMWQAKREKLRYEEAAGILGNIDEICQRIGQRNSVFITELKKLLFVDLPPIFEGKAAREISALGQEKLTEFLNRFADGYADTIRKKS